MKSEQEIKARAVVTDAADYLRSCGIRLPRFRITTEFPGDKRWGGSFVDGFDGNLRLNLGCYPLLFQRHWFAMHELGHLLWHHHKPLRWKSFAEAFGKPQPRGYDNLASKLGGITAGAGIFSRVPGPHRPRGEPSWYGARAGGEERFCELIGLMYANADFACEPPADLAILWDTCWNQGLARMT